MRFSINLFGLRFYCIDILTILLNFQLKPQFSKYKSQFQISKIGISNFKISNSEFPKSKGLKVIFAPQLLLSCQFTLSTNFFLSFLSLNYGLVINLAS